jgi:hypothetical protein
MKEMTQSMRRTVRRSMRVSTRRKINELIIIWVSRIIKVPLLNSLVPEPNLIHVTSMATKHANKSFLSWLGGFFLHTSHGVKGWLGIGWVASFGGFDGFLRFVVVGGRNKPRITLLILVLTSLKANTQFVCGYGCSSIHPQSVSCSQYFSQVEKSNRQPPSLVSVLFGSMEKLTLEKITHLPRSG